MQSNDDFAPIAEQGEFGSEGGLFTRLKRKRPVEPTTPGFARIVLDEKIGPVDEVTAGQRYWARGLSWVKVDVRDHHLAYEIDFPDPSGLAGFLARVDLVVRVCEPRGAVEHGAEGVREIVRPALQRAIRATHNASAPNPGDVSPVNALNELRLAAIANLENLDEPLPGVPDWLEVSISSVSVDFDEATSKHRTELMEKMRAVALADADGATELAKARNELKVRQLWEESFAQHLADPERRALARIAADPSRENIDRIAGEFDQIEAQGRAAIVEVLREAVNKGYFAEDDAIYTAIGAMEKQYGVPQHTLERGEKAKQVEASGEEHVVEAETVETKAETEEEKEEDSGSETASGEDDEDEPGDTNWGER